MRKYSFLVPVYNVGCLLDGCAESLLTQTYDNYEIIFYNDCSTDDSANRCEKYVRQYPEKIKLISGNKNIGPLRGRLEMLKYATGDICICVDSDDYVERNLLGELENVFQKYDCDIAIYEHKREYNFYGLSVNRRFHQFHGIEIYNENNKKDFYKKFSQGNMISIWSKAFKKNIFSFPYSDEIKDTVVMGEDLLFSLALVTEAKKIVCMGKPLYVYRVNPGSLSNAGGIKKLEKTLNDRKIILEQFADYVDGWGIETGEFHDYLIRITCNFIYAISEVEDWNIRYELYDKLYGISVIRETVEVSQFDGFMNAFGNREFSLMESMLDKKRKFMVKVKKIVKCFLR